MAKAKEGRTSLNVPDNESCATPSESISMDANHPHPKNKGDIFSKKKAYLQFHYSGEITISKIHA